MSGHGTRRRRRRLDDGAEESLNRLHDELVSAVESDLLGDPLTSDETWVRLPPAGKAEDLNERVDVLGSVLTRVRREVARDETPEALSFVVEFDPSTIDAMRETVDSVAASLSATAGNMASVDVATSRSNMARLNVGESRRRAQPSTLVDGPGVSRTQSSSSRSLVDPDVYPTAERKGDAVIGMGVRPRRLAGVSVADRAARDAEAVRVRSEAQSWARRLAAWVRESQSDRLPVTSDVSGDRWLSASPAGRRDRAAPVPPWR